MATIVLTGGGSAGHVTPHLAILPYLQKDFDKIYYIGSENGIEKDICTKANIEYFSVPCVKLYRNLTTKNLKIPYTLLLGINKAKKLLKTLKPDVIFSKGGYVALPTVIAGSKLKIPVICHESDYSIGLANKISSKYASKVLTSFPYTAKIIKKGEHVGSPIRNFKNIEKEECYKFFGFNTNKPVLLITGGSQGAVTINNNVRNSLPSLLENFNVIHLCGKGNVDNSLTQKGYYQAEYLDKIEYAFSIASVCVSRAGSNTLFELLSKNIPTLLIPLPKGVSRGDQILNAEYFASLGLCSILNQKNLTPNSLYTQIMSVYNNRKVFTANFATHPIKDASRTISHLLSNYKR